MAIVMNDKLKIEMKDAENAFHYNRNEDSKVPVLSVGKDYTELSFKKNGVNYYLSNEYGHTAVAYYSNKRYINNISILLTLSIKHINGYNAYTKQLSKDEFIQAKKHVLELLKNCSDEYKIICLDVINKLDYEEGYNNYRFSINPNLPESDKILRIRFQYNNFIYDWNLENNSLIKANIDDPFARSNKKEIKGLEKKLVLRTMHKSSVLDKKIGEFYNK